MRLILHIGMGKTGTSAVQRALAQAGDGLRRQRAAYLGMDFDLPDATGPGWRRRAALYRSDPEQLARAGQTVAETLARRAAAEGIGTFLLSNESLTGQAAVMERFLAPIRAVMAVEALAWARNPTGWLPSAYAQWGIRDKTFPQVPAYREGATRLVGHYRGVLEWLERMPELVRLHAYRRDSDIVAEFAAAAGIDLPPAPERFYERREPAEQILRARFAASIEGRVRPDLFDASVLPPKDNPPPLQRMIARYLDYGETGAIVAEHAALFDRIAETSGIDLRALPEEPPERPQVGPVRNRLIDLLVEVGLHQARRINELEARIAALEAGGARAPGPEAEG